MLSFSLLITSAIPAAQKDKRTFQVDSPFGELNTNVAAPKNAIALEETKARHPKSVLFLCFHWQQRWSNLLPTIDAYWC